MKELQLKITNKFKHLQAPAETISRFSPKDKAKIAGASKDFESLLTGMMIKSMTSTTNGLFGEDSYGSDIFDTVFNQQLSSYISENSGMGIAEQIYRKVTGEKWDESLINDKMKTKGISSGEKTEKNKKSFDNISIEEQIVPSHGALKRIKKFEPIINEMSGRFKMDKNVIRSIILAESAGNDKAVSRTKAKGLMQLMDKTAREMGVNNSFDPKENIYGGTKYLNRLLNKYNGNLKLSLAAYNAGPGNVDKYNGVPPFNETNSYINRVIGYYNYFNGNENDTEI